MLLKLRNSSFKDSIDVHSDPTDPTSPSPLKSPEKWLASYKQLQELNNKQPLLSPTDFNNWTSSYPSSKLFNEDMNDTNNTRLDAIDNNSDSDRGSTNSKEVHDFLNDSLELVRDR